MVVSPASAIKFSQHDICEILPVNLLVVPIRICESFWVDLRLLAYPQLHLSSTLVHVCIRLQMYASFSLHADRHEIVLYSTRPFIPPHPTHAFIASAPHTPASHTQPETTPSPTLHNILAPFRNLNCELDSDESDFDLRSYNQSAIRLPLILSYKNTFRLKNLVHSS